MTNTLRGLTKEVVVDVDLSKITENKLLDETPRLASIFKMVTQSNFPNDLAVEEQLAYNAKKFVQPTRDAERDAIIHQLAVSGAIDMANPKAEENWDAFFASLILVGAKRITITIE